MIDVKRLLASGREASLKVGIGLPAEAVAAMSRRLFENGAKLQVVGFDDPFTLVGALRRGEVAAAVRGALPSSLVLRELKRAFALEEVMRTAILEDFMGKQFLLTPVGIDEGMDMKSRLGLAKATVSYFSPAEWDISIAVLSKGREEDADRGPDIRSSLAAGERIARSLREEGLRAEHCGILVEEAVRRHDLILAPDGVTGNLMFRMLHFVGGGKAFGAPVVNMQEVFVDTSRAKADFTEPVCIAAGLALVRSTHARAP